MRTVSRLPLLVVLLLTLTAGCSGFADGMDTDDRQPYGVEEPLESSLVDPTDLEGVSDDGIDRRALVEGHTNALEGTSYTVSETTHTTDENGTVLTDRVRTSQFSADRVRSSTRVQQRESAGVGIGGLSGSDERTDSHYWQDENTSLLRVEDQNGTAEFHGELVPQLEFTVSEFVDPVASANETELSTADYDDGHYTIIAASEPTAESNYLADEPFSVELFVREDGLIRYASVEATVAVFENQHTLSREFLVEDVGETTLERPEWYDEALEEVGETDGVETDWR